MCGRLLVVLVVSAVATCASAFGQTLAWDSNSEADLAGYRVYQGTGSRNYTVVVDVGTATSYAIHGLTRGTWYFAVTAYNTSGLESGFSDEVSTVIATESTPPVLTSRTTRILTNDGVSIAWTADEPVTATIEYGLSADYGSSVVPTGTATIAQSVRLSGLLAATAYHYRLKLTDSSGNVFVSEDATFTTAPSPSSIVATQVSGYPRRVSNLPFVGFGLTNTGETTSAVRLTAFDSSGQTVAGPIALLLAPGEQVTALDGQVFGDSISTSGASWVKVETSSGATSGIFFGLDNGPTKMDGGTLRAQGLTEFVLPGPGGLNLLNPNPNACVATLELTSPDGALLGSVQRAIPGNGSLASSAGFLFPGVEASPGYLRVSTTGEVFSFAAVVDTAASLAIVPGLETRNFAPVLYAPDFIGGGGWHSTITVIGTEALPGSFTARLFADDGTPITEPVVYRLPGRGRIRITDTELIGSEAGDAVRGYVEISTNVSITGALAIEFNGQAASAFRLISGAGQSFVIGQVASDSNYYTGAALLNPGSDAASVVLELHTSDGTLVDTWSGVLGPRERILQLMTQYFPELDDLEMTSGYVTVAADRNIAVLSLFGRNDLSVLSAIPPD